MKMHCCVFLLDKVILHTMSRRSVANRTIKPASKLTLGLNYCLNCPELMDFHLLSMCLPGIPLHFLASSHVTKTWFSYAKLSKARMSVCMHPFVSKCWEMLIGCKSMYTCECVSLHIRVYTLGALYWKSQPTIEALPFQ